MRKNNAFMNQRGIGLVGALIAAAMVVTIAMTVAYVVSDQHRQSKKLQLKGSCENIANSLVEYIKKDETSLFISSYGPNAGSVNFPAGLDETDDGIDRFNFSSAAIPMYSTTGTGILNLPPTATALPNGWQYFNHLNIRNSTNRLVALASSGNFCCDGLNMGANCGARFYDDATPRPGFSVADRGVEIDLGVDFDGIACTARRLAHADIPNSRSATRAQFKVQVTVNRGTDSERTCSATGTVQRTADTTPAITLIQYGNLCGGSVTTPAVCGTPTPIQITLRTFKSNTGTACQTNCLRNIQSLTCAQAAGPGVDLFDTFGNTACNDCVESEPGTAFLCRIGEKSWMNNPANADIWQPCENATVWDHDGSAAGSVTINYNPMINGNAATQRTANAVLTLSGLRSMRGYVVDVRTVDTAGNVGPSFCNPTNGSPSCDSTAAAHFTIIDSTPTFGGIVDNANIVDGAGLPLGRQNPALPLPRYTGALSAFSGGRFQCQAGAPQFQGSVLYAPPPPAGPASIPHTCTATVTSATTGTVVTIPQENNPATSPGCNCQGVDCTARLPAYATEGNHTLRMNVVNPCGPLPVTTQNWCADLNTSIGATYSPGFDFATSTPNFTSLITHPPAAFKACGLSTLCPNIDGSFTPVMGPTCAVGGWAPNDHSGCLRDPTGNYCALIVDPCGRYQENKTPPMQYSTPLVSVPHTSAPTTNSCFTYGGTQRGGNYCESGFCSRTGKCFNSCPKSVPAAPNCNVDADCDDPLLGRVSTDPDGPKCVANRCTCGTNVTTPAANDCSQEYCAPLNSCTTPPATIGSSTGNVACISCGTWNLGPWGACTQTSPGVWQQTRTATCGSSCCIGPDPSETRPCPSCGPANGNTYGSAAAANAAGLCSSGTPAPLSLSGTPATWNWTCNEGTPTRTVNCSATYVAPGCWSCATGGAECSPGPAAGCSYNGYRTAHAQPDLVGTTCPTIGAAFPFQRTLPVGVICDPGRLECAATCGPAPQNATCGTANGTTVATAPSGASLCGVGTATAVAGSGPWTWNCNGINGGTNASCSASTNVCAPAYGSPGAIALTSVAYCSSSSPISSIPGGSNPNGPSTGPSWSCFRSPAAILSYTINQTGYDYYYIRLEYTYQGVPGFVEHSGQVYAGVDFWICGFDSSGRITNPADPSYCESNGYNGSAPAGTPYVINSHAFTPGGTTPFGPPYLRFDTWLTNNNPCVPVVNGACGPANGTTVVTAPSGGSLCSAGTASAVSGSGPWTWTCNGSGGGTNANCSALEDTGGVCGWQQFLPAGGTLEYGNQPAGALCDACGGGFDPPGIACTNGNHGTEMYATPYEQCKCPFVCDCPATPPVGCTTCAAQCGGSPSGGGCLCPSPPHPTGFEACM